MKIWVCGKDSIPLCDITIILLIIYQRFGILLNSWEWKFYLGQVTSESSPGPHLDPSDRIHRSCVLCQRCVAGGLPTLSDRIFQRLRFLTQLIKFVHRLFGSLAELRKHSPHLSSGFEDYLLLGSTPPASSCLSSNPHLNIEQ